MSGWGHGWSGPWSGMSGWGFYWGGPWGGEWLSDPIDITQILAGWEPSIAAEVAYAPNLSLVASMDSVPIRASHDATVSRFGVGYAAEIPLRASYDTTLSFAGTP